MLFRSKRISGMESKHRSMLLTFDHFIETGAIVYVDKSEESSMVIDGVEFDEITPSGMMSLTVASIPFSCRNQAPRNIYQSSMGKQAISFPSLIHEKSMNSVHSYKLNYPQKPLMETKFHELSCNPPMPTTQCAVVAIMIRGGFVQTCICTSHPNILI